jgi:peptidoglycan/xylan/chitin deacetylase (PgdA/CDA1 family)
MRITQYREIEMTAVINICFHGIGTPQGELEPEAAGYFVSRAVFLAVLDEMMAYPEVTQLSFDDGFVSDVEIALPALQERGVFATFFPLAGKLGRPGHVDPTDLRALATAGMTIGSHGMRHRSWRGLDAKSSAEEFTVARSVIADAAGTQVRTAACPFGAYDRHVLAALHNHGYTQVFTSDRRRARLGSWLQPRYSVLHGDTARSVRDNILASRPYQERLRRTAAARVKAWR